MLRSLMIALASISCAACATNAPSSSSTSTSTPTSTSTNANANNANGDARAAKEGGPLLIENARVFGHPNATHVLIAGNKIEKIGGPELRAWTASRSFDAAGGLVLPGFNDAHIHMLGGGLSLARVQIAEAKTLDDTLARIKGWADTHPERAWVLGRGWSYDIVPKGTFPTAAMLDKIIPDRPVAVDAYDGHTTWLNSKALALAKITKDTKDPADGKIVRDASGNPTGALLEGAEVLLEGVVPEPDRAEKKDALAAAAMSCAQLGLTSVDAIEGDLETFDLFLELEREKRLPLKVRVILPIEGDFDQYVEMRKRGSERVKIVGVKGFVDGVVEAKTAYMKKPFTGSKSERGAPLIPPAKLDELVLKANERGLFVALHAIGDAAVALSLDAFEKVPANKRQRNRVEHIEVIDDVDVPRFAKIGAVASMQPYHSVPYEPDPDAGAWSENLGKERLAKTFAWKWLVDAKAPLEFGSDWPVYTNDPLSGLAVALSRQNENGFPPGGWNAKQAVDANVAIAAYAPGRAIAEGASADVVVLPADVDLAKPSTLWGKRPVLVLVDGERALNRGAR